MGFHLYNYEDIPSKYKWYIFLTGDYRNHSFINNFFRDEFILIARRIRGSAIIQSCFEPGNGDDTRWQLLSVLRDTNCSKVNQIIDSINDDVPALLLFNYNPWEKQNLFSLLRNAREMLSILENLPDDFAAKEEIINKQSIIVQQLEYKINQNSFFKPMVIYIPFEIIEKTYQTNTNALLHDLVALTRYSDMRFVKNTQDSYGQLKRLHPTISLNVGVISFSVEF